MFKDAEFLGKWQLKSRHREQPSQKGAALRETLPRKRKLIAKVTEGIERFPHPSKAHRKPNALAVPGIRDMDTLPSPLGMFGWISQKFTCWKLSTYAQAASRSRWDRRGVIRVREGNEVGTRVTAMITRRKETWMHVFLYSCHTTPSATAQCSQRTLTSLQNGDKSRHRVLGWDVLLWQKKIG